MSSTSSFLDRTLFTLAIAVVLSFSIQAQTTIFNVPTADTLQRGSVNLEADFVAKPTRYSEGGYQTYGYRVAYGLNHKTEIGFNSYYAWNGSNSIADIEFSLKRRIYQNERHGVSASVGTIVFVPLRNNFGDRTSIMIYGTARKTVESLHGLTLTGGAYHFFRGSQSFGTRTGAIIGAVQPLNKRISFVADWYSGQNRFGYSSAAFNFNLTPRQYLMAGYSFGNSGRGNNALAAYYGITF